MNECYDEELYLNSEYLIEYYSKLGVKYTNLVEREKIIYADVFYYYDLLLDRTIKLLRNIGFNNSLEYSIALSYLIECGYLSKDFVFKPGIDTNEIKTKMGISIIDGVGCCRNFSSLHKDIFDKMDLSIKPFYCYEGNNFFKKSRKRAANHVLNLVEYDDNTYGIDLYNNNMLYHFKNKYFLKSISSYYSGDLRYKPYYELMMGESNIEDIKKTLELFDEYSTRSFISPLEYEEIKYDTSKRMKKEEDSLYDFFNSTSDLKEKVLCYKR